MQITVQDRQTYKITNREFTDEGFLRVPGKVARTGIQQYLACELGLAGDPNRIINVYRPEEEVFAEDSLASFDGVDITLQHPSALVNSENYSTVSKGVVRGSGVRTDDNFVQCSLLIKAKDTVDAVLNGTCELSAGYTATYDDTPGTTPDGEQYHYRQTNIRINHVAVVDRARAGSTARIFDSGEKAMHQITTDTGRVLEVADAAVADAFDRLNKRVNDAEAATAKAQATNDGLQAKVDDLNGKLETAVKASSDEAIKARVEEVAQVQTKARKVAGDSFSCDSVNTTEIMRAALTAAKPKRDFSDKSADYIQAAFDMAAEEEDEEEKKKDSKDSQYKQLAQDGAKAPAQAGSAYEEFKRKTATAYLGSK